MDKTQFITVVGLGIANLAVQLYVSQPSIQKISIGVKNLDTSVNQTNQILKEERQTNKKEFKDL